MPLIGHSYDIWIPDFTIIDIMELKVALAIAVPNSHFFHQIMVSDVIVNKYIMTSEKINHN